ncbi:hypothetical protein BC937DRAFT_93023 [Endogone sp. FLAS-F59071]|nr:hypothetical protein BC937DRAFT_93023 [Endogone sp. FLAS-F59071]|eukprot:RUS15016.1 hypothetical protein BC937DRAFT_93023 [Endogone sp. FLAS-F59071]
MADNLTHSPADSTSSSTLLARPPPGLKKRKEKGKNFSILEDKQLFTSHKIQSRSKGVSPEIVANPIRLFCHVA